MESKRAGLLVLCAAILFGTTGTAKALGPDGMDSVTLGAARIAIGGLLILALAWKTDAFIGVPEPSWRLVIPAGAAVIAYQMLFFQAVDRAGVSIATIVAIGSGPAWAGAIELLVLKRELRPTWFVSVAIAIAGVVLLVAGSSSSKTGDQPALGVLLAVGAGLGYGIYAVIGGLLIERGQRPEGSMGLVFGTAAVIALPILFATLPGGLDSLGGLATAIYLGVVPTALAYTLFGIGLRTLSASTVTTIVLAEPVVATILGVVVLDEQLTAVSLLGGGLVFVALAVLAIPGQSARAYPEPQAE